MFFSGTKSSNSPTDKVEHDDGITMLDQNIITPEIESFVLLNSSLGMFSPKASQSTEAQQVVPAIKTQGSNQKLSVIIPVEKELSTSAYYDGNSSVPNYYCVSPLSCCGLTSP
jgi:hypothetical protein